MFFFSIFFIFLMSFIVFFYTSQLGHGVAYHNGGTFSLPKTLF